MKRIFKRFISLLCTMLLALQVCSVYPKFKVEAATWDDINQSSVFLKQENKSVTSGTCTLCAAAMLVRRVAMMRGDSDWATITESSLKNADGMNWDVEGLSWDFSIRGIRILHPGQKYALSKLNEEEKINTLKKLLESCPEGIVAYDRDKPHAILLTDYTDGVFYCAEPAGSNYGRIPISKATITIAGIDDYWYCSSPLINLETSVTPSKPTLSITPGTTTQPTRFSWNACSNADWYDVRIWFPNSDEPLTYWECNGTSLSVNLPEGKDFWANVAPVNAEHGTYTFSDNIYFDVGLGTCEPSAISTYNGHIYALYDNLTNYGQAQELCRKMGGHLATITSAEENKVVSGLISNPDLEYWLGANDTALEGAWVWETGEPFSYSKWHKDDENQEPNNYDGLEHYLTLYKDGTWNDARYNAHFYDNGNGFILETEPQTPAAIKEYNNHVYYRFDSSLNWKEAKAYCELLGGHLVTISDQKENDFVANLISSGTKNMYWIGLYDAAKNKKYKWITGESTGYFNWADTQPDCYQEIEFYGEMYRESGTWNDNANYYGSEEGFVCEIEKTVTSISVESLPKKRTYYSGETLDLTGLSLLVKHQVGEDAVVTSGFTTSVDMNSSGEKTVTLT